MNLVDTPGHVDFRAEVSSSFRSSDSALLLVDASQGVQGKGYPRIIEMLEFSLTIL